MKKTLTTLLACATLGLAYGQETASNATQEKFGMEINAVYNFGLKDLYKYDSEDHMSNPEVNTYGFDVTTFYALDENNVLNLRIGWATGDDSVSGTESLPLGLDDEATVTTTHKWEVQNIYFMPGYRYTGEVADGLKLFAGANIGLAQTNVTRKETLTGFWGADPCDKETKSKWGFAWSAEIGLQQAVCESGSISFAVQLQGLMGRPNFGEPYDGTDKVQHQLNLGLRLGYSCQF